MGYCICNRAIFKSDDNKAKMRMDIGRQDKLKK